MPQYHYPDHMYMLFALHGGGADVQCPVARATLTRMGYMVPAKVSKGWRGGYYAFGMTLTKKGQKRAQEIAAQMQAAPRRQYGPSYRPKSRKLARVYG